MRDRTQVTVQFVKPWYFLPLRRMKEIVFNIEICPEAGGFVARWDDPKGGGITTQGDTLTELHSMVADAVTGYFEPGKYPRHVRTQFAGV